MVPNSVFAEFSMLTAVIKDIDVAEEIWRAANDTSDQLHFRRVPMQWRWRNIAIILELRPYCSGLAAVFYWAHSNRRSRLPRAHAEVAPSSPAPKSLQDDCELVREYAGDLQKRKAAGLTEREALVELSARGEYTRGYVADGVFGANADTSDAMTRLDIMESCKHLAKTGTVY